MEKAKSFQPTCLLCQGRVVSAAIPACSSSQTLLSYLSLYVVNITIICWSLTPCFTMQLWGSKICRKKRLCTALPQATETQPGITQNCCFHIQLLSKDIGGTYSFIYLFSLVFISIRHHINGIVYLRCICKTTKTAFENLGLSLGLDLSSYYN